MGRAISENVTIQAEMKKLTDHCVQGPYLSCRNGDGWTAFAIFVEW